LHSGYTSRVFRSGLRWLYRSRNKLSRRVEPAGDIVIPGFEILGNVPVLAERAAQIAARETSGQYFRTRPEMVEGFFLDWINGKGGDESVKGKRRFTLPVDPDPALAFSSRSYNAAVGTEAAL